MRLLRFFKICGNHWWWYVLSLLICLSLAYKLQKYMPKVYTSKAAIMLNEEGNKTGDVIFPDLGFTPAVNVSNRVQSMNKVEIAKEIVEKFRLDVEYEKPGRFFNHKYPFAESPIQVEFVGEEWAESCIADIVVGDQGQCKINFHSGQDKGREEYYGFLSDTIFTQKGPLIVNAVQATDMEKGTNIRVTKLSINEAVSKVRSSFKFRQRTRATSIIDLTCSASSDYLAREMLLTFIDFYEKYWMNDHNALLLANDYFLNQRIKVIEEELDGIDQEIADFRSSTMTLNESKYASDAVSEFQMIRKQLNDLERKMEMIQYVKDYIEDNELQMTTFPAGLENEDIAQQIKVYNELMIERNLRVSNSSVQNPKVQDMDNTLKRLSKSITMSLEQEILHLQKIYERTELSMADLEKFISDQPIQTQYLTSMGRQQKVKENLFLYLLEKREENHLNETLNSLPVQIVDPPTLAASVQTPYRVNPLIAGGLIGLLLPTFILYILELCASKVVNKEDIESEECQVFQLLKKRRKDYAMIGCEIEQFSINNSSANTYIISTLKKGRKSQKAMKIIGKSLRSIGHKVIFIDFNYRIKKREKNKKNYLQRYISGEIDDYRPLIALQDEIPAICGIDNDFSHLCLRNPRLGCLINNLRADFDYVFMSLPSAIDYPDASIAAKLADATIIVAQMRKTKISTIQTLKKWKEQGRFPRLSVLLYR